MFKVGQKIKERRCGCYFPEQLRNKIATVLHVHNNVAYILKPGDECYSKGSKPIDGAPFSWIVRFENVIVIDETGIPKRKKKKSDILIDEYWDDSIEVKQTECCGIYELAGLYGPDFYSKVFKVRQSLHSNYNMLIFHDAVKYGNGRKFAKFVEDKKFGSITPSKMVMNPNTGRKVRMWVWYPNWKNIDKMCANAIINYDE